MYKKEHLDKCKYAGLFENMQKSISNFEFFSVRLKFVTY